jgi:hypothetical protein
LPDVKVIKFIVVATVIIIKILVVDGSVISFDYLDLVIIIIFIINFTDLETKRFEIILVKKVIIISSVKVA